MLSVGVGKMTIPSAQADGEGSLHLTQRPTGIFLARWDQPIDESSGTPVKNKPWMMV